MTTTLAFNTIKPAKGAKTAPRRVGRGIGSGLGKTCGSGHKGQKARAGGFHKLGFEGGQMPMQRRMPKSGFKSRMAHTADEVRLMELEKLSTDNITLASLLEAGIIKPGITRVKIIATGKLTKKLTVSGLQVTKGARAAILAAGGQIVE